MVERITPTYYASGEVITEYRLEGMGLLQIPTDAVGVIADSNGAPLNYRTTENQEWMFRVVVENDFRARVVPYVVEPHVLSTYLGGIVSADRATVYWENTSRPLP